MKAGVATLAIAKFLSYVLTIAMPLYLARHFSMAQFGLYKLVFNVVTNSVAILSPMIGMTSFYFFPREPETRTSVAGNIILMGAIVGILPLFAFLLNPVLFLKLFKDPATVADAPLIGIVVFLWTIAYLIELVPIANQDYDFATAGIIVGNVFRALCLLVSAFLTQTVHGMLIGSVVYGIVQAGFFVYYVQSRFPGFLKASSLSIMKRQWAYIFKILPANLLGDLQTFMPLYFVGFRYSLAASAVFAAGCFNIPVTGMLLESFGSILIRKVGELERAGNRREIVRIILASARKLSLAFFPFYVLMLVIRREFIVTIFTDRYVDSIPIFVLNISLIPFTILMFDPIWRAFPDQKFKVLAIRGTATFVLFMALWFGTAHYGPIAASAAMLVAAIAERIGLTILWGRFLHVRRADLEGLGDVGRVALASLGAGIVTWMVRLTLLGLMKPIWIGVACGCVLVPVYVALLLVLQVPTPEERRMVTGRLASLTRVARLA